MRRRRLPKPNRGKTRTIKERAIYVYLPSEEMAGKWKKEADAAGISTSKFVTDRVEDSLRREEGEEGYVSRVELIKKVRDSEEELKELRRENALLKKLAENLDNELKRYRAKPFAEEGFQGVRAFEKGLVELLRAGRSYDQEEILSRLNVNPTDMEMVRAVSRQLEALEEYGLVEYSGRGWRWKSGQ
jgi:hypothetical protein